MIKYMINNNFSRAFLEDINYLPSYEDFPSYLKDRYSANIFVLLTRWLIVIFKGLLAIIYFFFNYNKSLPHFGYVFFSVTNNNYRALKPIQEKMGNNAKIFTTKYPSFQKVWFYGMLYSPIIFLRYLKCSGYLKKAYSSEFISFSLTYGYLIESRKILQQAQPSFLIIANDHTYPQRAFFRMAQSLRIKTVYVQHASVEETYPPLEFDYVFLDGQESFDKYIANNKICKSTVFLTGSARFDIIKNLTMNRMERDISRLGIAVNAIDIVEKVEQFIYYLQKCTQQLQITIRPHPLQKLSIWKQMAEKYNCNFSNPQSENPFQFISQNDFFISGESSFHLDAVLSGKISYYFNFTNGDSVDGYGYIKNGLVKYFSDDVLMKIITKNINNIRNDKLIQYYVANYATPFWGKASDVIALTLKQLFYNKQYPDFWIEREVKGIKYFELNKDFDFISEGE